LKENVRRALVYALWTTFPREVSARRVALSEFYHSLNRRKVLTNDETAEEVEKGYRHLSALKECAEELGRRWGLDACVEWKLREERS